MSKQGSGKGNPAWTKGMASPNPSGKRRADAARSFARRVDGLENVITGLGSSGYDKRLGATWAVDTLVYSETETLWRGNGLAARIIETPIDEMFRKGFELAIQAHEYAAGDAPKRDDARLDFAGSPAPAPKTPGPVARPDGGPKALVEALVALYEQLNGAVKLREGLLYGEAHGGGAVLMGVNDGRELHEPVDEANVVKVHSLTAFTSQELYAETYYADPTRPRFGDPELYVLAPVGSTTASYARIHESRLIISQGVVVSRNQMVAGRGWGDSVLVRCLESLRDFGLTWGGAAVLMQDFAQAIVRIKDLADTIGANGEDVIRARMKLMELSKSSLRTLVLDSEETYERQATPITGMPEMLDRFCQRLAADARQPVTLLMGQAPAGLNATGASDIRFFYDRCAARQESTLRPQLDKLFRLLMLSHDGPCRGVEPENWSITFRPLYEMTAKEDADIRLAQATVDEKYIMQGVLTPEEVAASRFGGDRWNSDTTLDFDARDVALEVSEQAEEDFKAEEKVRRATKPVPVEAS